MKNRGNIKAMSMRGRAATLCPLLLPALLLLSSCSVIDEDLSNCNQASLNYDLQLVTNMTTELKTELTTQTDIQLANALKEHLSDIFTDFAHDVDLSFYDTQGDSMLLQKDRHIMDANQASYSLNLPMRQYMHLAAANVVDNDVVAIADDGRCHRSVLQQVVGDTIDSHSTGLFTARQPMDVLDNVSQNFDVHLYMANCAAALVIDTRGYEHHGGLRVFSTGFASKFSICDSVFHFAAKPPVVRTTEIALPDGNPERAFCSVTFPSREPNKMSTRNVIETLEPFIAEDGEESLWEFIVYVPQPDGSITMTRLRIRQPLRAGQLKIIKCWIGENGAVISVDPEVSTSVTLDWKPGLIFTN